MEYDNYSTENDDNDSFIEHVNMIDGPDHESVAWSQESGDIKKTEFLITKKSDKGYFYLKQRNNKRNTFIEGYSTPPSPGYPIRNAVSGHYQMDSKGKSAKVGSRLEDQYFKVVLTGNGIGKEPRIVFYDSIVQYERHFKTTVDQATRDKWNQKQSQFI